MMNPSKIFENFKNAILTKYGPNPAKMLIYTGVLGWFLSSAAQVVAIIVNDKIPKEQKMFLIPQEIADAAVNILSFYTLTSGVKYIGAKLTKTAKLRTAELTNLLKKGGHVLEKGEKRLENKVYAGDWNFDITKLENYNSEIADKFKPFRNGAEVITGLIGSVISSNIVTPIARNKYAAIKQKQAISNMNNPADSKNSNNPVKFYNRISMETYQKLASVKYSAGSLKI